MKVAPIENRDRKSPSLLVFSVVRESLSTLAAVVHNTEVQATFNSNLDDTVSSRVVMASDCQCQSRNVPGSIQHPPAQ